MEGVPNALPTGLSKRGNARARPGNEAAKNGFRVEGGEEIGTRRITVKGGWARKGWKGGLTTTPRIKKTFFFFKKRFFEFPG